MKHEIELRRKTYEQLQQTVIELITEKCLLEKEIKHLKDIKDYYKHEYYSVCDILEKMEKALDKACGVIISDICINCYACYFEKECKSKEADKCIANNMNKEEWKEWMMKDE